MGCRTNRVQVLHQVYADKALATQITGAGLVPSWRE